MLTQEENELLTGTDRGTPAGEWMRRYWQPVALSEEVPPGGAPVPVRLLGEDLVLFRTPSPSPLPQGGEGKGEGGIGLLGLHCSHRGADLSYGRLEDGGLRCIYHGWLYDIHGRCLEQPGEPAPPIADSGLRSAESAPAQSALRNRHSAIKHMAYPCLERAGAIFAYLGPGEPPLFPNYEFFTLPDDQVFAIKLFSECNYLQGSEGNYDWIHTSFLHSSRRRWDGALPDGINGEPFKGPVAHSEWVEARLKPWGLQHIKINPGAGGWGYSLGTFLMPAVFCFGGGSTIEGHSLNWHVPIDDTHHWKFTFIFNRVRPLDKNGTRRGRADMTPDYHPIRNRSNRYLQDRESMKTESYSGMGFVFQPQDLCVTEGPGPIQDRTQEHLGSTDVAIVAARHMLSKAIRDVQEGLDPAHVVRDSAQNRFPYTLAWSGTVPAGTDWKSFFDELDSELAVAAGTARD